MFTLLFIMILGIALGFLLRQQKSFLLVVEQLMQWAIYALLFILGLQLGVNEQVLENIFRLGWQSLILAIGAVLGSLLCCFLIYRYFFQKRER